VTVKHVKTSYGVALTALITGSSSLLGVHGGFAGARGLNTGGSSLLLGSHGGLAGIGSAGKAVAMRSEGGNPKPMDGHNQKGSFDGPNLPISLLGSNDGYHARSNDPNTPKSNAYYLSTIAPV